MHGVHRPEFDGHNIFQSNAGHPTNVDFDFPTGHGNASIPRDNSNISNIHPEKLGKMNPFWLVSKGFFNHQLDT